jgi:hypothetical protein
VSCVLCPYDCDVRVNNVAHTQKSFVSTYSLHEDSDIMRQHHPSVLPLCQVVNIERDDEVSCRGIPNNNIGKSNIQ